MNVIRKIVRPWRGRQPAPAFHVGMIDDTEGESPCFPLGRGIVDAYGNHEMPEIPEIGHCVDLMAGAAAARLDQDQHTEILRFHDADREGATRNVLDRISRGFSYWVEFNSAQEDRGVLMSPVPGVEGTIRFVAWIMVKNKYPSIIPVIAEWRGIDPIRAPANPVPSPEDRIVFMETPGTRKLITLAMEAGEMPKDARVQDLCLPTMHLIIRGFAALAAWPPFEIPQGHKR